MSEHNPRVWIVAASFGRGYDVLGVFSRESDAREFARRAGAGNVDVFDRELNRPTEFAQQFFRVAWEASSPPPPGASRCET